ncbi:uroporphyrinogen-III synthase [Promicromonospora sp. NPDC057488]|uniref:uroporphyrinogen-III synthase n=1 Tax=Promicromonospora sp. NPDC057488 TaxID=3346147 RepID=UPI0036728632
MTEPVHPTAGPSGTAGPADLARRPVVLVARAPERAAGLVALLRERGLDPVAAPVIERAPVEDPAELDAARERLAGGAYDWVAITSVNAVDALLGPAPDGAAAGGPDGPGEDTTSSGSFAGSRQRLPSATHLGVHDAPPGATPDAPGTPATGWVRWAAVGPATQQALAAHGLAIDLVPRTATGAGLAEAFPEAPGDPSPADAHPAAGAARAHRVLLPLGDLAADTVRAGLVAKGWAVDVVTAYRTVAHELPPELRRRYDVVVVASGSAARQVATQLGPQRVVAIGEPSAGTARAVGHTVLAVADAPTDAALADAVTQALVGT